MWEVGNQSMFSGLSSQQLPVHALEEQFHLIHDMFFSFPSFLIVISKGRTLSSLWRVGKRESQTVFLGNDYLRHQIEPVPTGEEMRLFI